MSSISGDSDKPRSHNSSNEPRTFPTSRKLRPSSDIPVEQGQDQGQN